MRKWVVWCINHRMKFIVQAVLIALLPIYMVTGAVAGCVELIKEWCDEWCEILERPTPRPRKKHSND